MFVRQLVIETCRFVKEAQFSNFVLEKYKIPSYFSVTANLWLNVIVIMVPGWNHSTRSDPFSKMIYTSFYGLTVLRNLPYKLNTIKIFRKYNLCIIYYYYKIMSELHFNILEYRLVHRIYIISIIRFKIIYIYFNRIIYLS